MSLQTPTLIIVCGPTASGKTDYALGLAKYYNTEILSIDSRQVYKEMTIGTAKPSKKILEQIPHHFINHCSIFDTFNAGIFEKQALSVLEQLFIKHRVIIAVGGTGLYMKALCEGLDNLPKANEILRQKLQLEIDNNGIDFIYKKLQNLDIESSKRVDPKNPHRIMRAIELLESTNQSLMELMSKPKAERPFKIIKVMMDIDRKILYERIEERAEIMMKDGLLAEVECLLAYKNLKALQTVGYNELFQYLDGTFSLNEAILKIKQHTRNYAKRQLTWFKQEKDLILHHQFNHHSIL